ncbi:cytochrome P450 [Penicillium taxi]|uniref:cytochrome P450 n=1 Tax=Penicillium taxi TaxID=168475 RepID=UPI00254585A2|nr:cytochrome P450 [Penicillium taxi]KAJ5909077.1 cytochrome P450 [Penicillium taxi]
MGSHNHSIPIVLSPVDSIRNYVSSPEPSEVWLRLLIWSVIVVVVSVILQKSVDSSELSHLGETLAGSEPYIIRSGPFRELVISQPAHVHEFYRHDTKAHSKPPNFNLGKPFGCLMGNAVGIKYGEAWRRMRQYFDPEFALHRIAQQIPCLSQEIHQWVDRIMVTPSVVIHAKRSFQFLTFRLLAVHLYGEAFSELLYERLLELNALHEIIIRDMLLSKCPDSKLWNILPTAARRRLQAYINQWRKFNQAIIGEARMRNLSCPIERIFRGVDQKKDMEEDEFLQTLDEILFTNVDVSARVLGTLFTHLSIRPSLQVLLRDEIQHWKHDPDLNLPKYMAQSDTLLNRMVMESMRHSPAFGFSMPERTSAPKIIGGYFIPPHTSVVIDTRRLNLEDVTWGPDGAEFRPERFSEMPKDKLRCGFMRFGAGAASGRCLGKYVADVVFKLTTMILVEQFSLGTRDTDGAGDIQVTRIEQF